MKMVSVVIPAKNGGKWIQNAIRSALKNDPLEVVVFDDNSTDDTYIQASKIQDSRLKVIKNPDASSGIGASFNKAFDASEGEFVTIVGQDDLIDPNYLERVMEVFKDDVSMVACHPRFIDSDGNPYTDQSDGRLHIPKPVNMTKEEFLSVFRVGNMYFGINTYRRSAVNEVGGFDGKAGWLLDLDLYIRLIKHSSIHIIEEELCSLTLSTETTSYITTSKIPQQRQYDLYVREKNFKPEKMKVALATPFYMSQENANYGEAMIYTTRMLTQAGIDWELIRVNGDSYVDRAKNTIIANFLESDCTDLVMIDSDESWHPLAISRLLQHPEDIVAGAYPFKNSWGRFAGNPLVEIKHGMPVYFGRELSDGAVLLEAYNIAGGFLRIKRDALVKYAQEYPNDVYMDEFAWPPRRNRIYTAFFMCDIKDFQRYGEDAYFSRRMKEIGIKLYIDPNITISHHGMNTWSGNLHESLLRKPEEIEAVKTEMAKRESCDAEAATIH